LGRLSRIVEGMSEDRQPSIKRRLTEEGLAEATDEAE
jgi:hypothetical protein